jgi:hypothetical protein
VFVRLAIKMRERRVDVGSDLPRLLKSSCKENVPGYEKLCFQYDPGSKR